MKLLKILLIHSPPSTVSTKFGFLLELKKKFSKEFVMFWALLFFEGTVQPNLQK